jgi:hypothetical protein
MGPQGSLLCSQQLGTESYCGPVQSSPHPHNLPHFNIIFPSMLNFLPLTSPD